MQASTRSIPAFVCLFCRAHRSKPRPPRPRHLQKRHRLIATLAEDAFPRDELPPPNFQYTAADEPSRDIQPSPKGAEKVAGPSAEVENEKVQNGDSDKSTIRRATEESEHRRRIRREQTVSKEKKGAPYRLVQSPSPPDMPSASTVIDIRKTFDPDNLELQPLETDQPPIPSLAHDLQRVLFNPGIYQLQDPRSQVYNFDPYLKSIMPVNEFDFEALSEYVTSSRDQDLMRLARERGKKYLGSSSSMTSVLSQFHFLLSGWRQITTSMLSRGFPVQHTSFSRITRAPAAVILRQKNGIYAIDADKEFDGQNILMVLGRSMEKLLTSSKEDFEQYRRGDTQRPPSIEKGPREPYHYSELGDFLIRAQLDAKDTRLPGTGVFDLKTRAVVSIRMDAQNYEQGLGYQIKDRFGQYESYEREFFDMMRTAFLKYSLQARIGRMDGIFVAYHNIQSLFGFQYIGLPELDSSLHGTSDTLLGDQELRISLGIWNDILDQITQRFQGRNVRILFEARESKIQPFMYIFAEPVEDEVIDQKQKQEAQAIQKFMKKVTGQDVVEENSHIQAMEARGIPRSPPLDNRNSQGKGTGEPRNKETDSIVTPGTANDTQARSNEILGLVVHIRNLVNGTEVLRPNKPTANYRWTVDLKVLEIPGERARQLYERCQKRRKTLLDWDGEKDVTAYIRKLRALSKAGREWVQGQNEQERGQEPVLLYEKGG
ncbi:MAG: hypothetical protein Q9227_003035 [Pyrenula ochraceoflavens]